MSKRKKVGKVIRVDKPLIPIRNVVVINDHNTASTHEDKRLKKPKYKKDLRFEV